MMHSTRSLPARDAQAAPSGSGRMPQPVASLRRHKWIAAGLFLIVLIGGLPLAWMKGKATYRSEGVLYVSPRFLRNLDSDEEHQLQSNSQYREFMQQQVRTVNRYDIVASVLTKHPELGRRWKRPNESDRRAAERLQGALQISPVPDTYQITVGLEDHKAEGLAEIINAVLAEFLAVSQKELLWDSEGRLQKLNHEKAALEAEMAGLAESKNSRAQELGTTVFNDSMVNSYDKRLAASLDALEEARRQRFAAEGAASGQALPGTSATALDKALSDAGLTSLKGSLNQRKATLLTTIHGLSPQHSGRISAEKELKEIEAQIEQTTAQIHQKMQSGLRDMQVSRLEQARQLEAKIQREVDQLRAQTEAYSRGYQSTLEIGEQIARLRKRLNATEDRMSFLSLETKAPGFIRVFSPARPADLPVKGGRRNLFLLVGLAALALALLLPVGIDFVDPRILTGRELEAALGLPISAVLDASGWNSGTRRLAVVVNRHSDALPHGALTLTAISGHADSSSAVTRALAGALTALGSRVLICETKPNPSESSDRPGLADLLAGAASLEACLVLGGERQPDHIGAGSASEDNLLPADRLPAILREARERYDVVLVDSPSVSGSLLAEELVRLTGAVMLVASAGADTKADLKVAMNLLERLRPESFGAVLAGTSRPAPLWIKNLNKREKNDTPALLAA